MSSFSVPRGPPPPELRDPRVLRGAGGRAKGLRNTPFLEMPMYILRNHYKKLLLLGVPTALAIYYVRKLYLRYVRPALDLMNGLAGAGAQGAGGGGLAGEGGTEMGDLGEMLKAMGGDGGLLGGGAGGVDAAELSEEQQKTERTLAEFDRLMQKTLKHSLEPSAPAPTSAATGGFGSSSSSTALPPAPQPGAAGGLLAALGGGGLDPAAALGADGQDPALFGGASLRIAGATEIRAKFGLAGRELIVARGRWKDDDIGFIYQRVTAVEQLEAMACLDGGGDGAALAPELESVLQGWTQPAFRTQ